MPSSVVFAALVVAWLVVLVPVVARRRQLVPRPAEADLSARVLRRTVGAPLIEEVPVATAQADGRAGGERATAGPATARATGGTASASAGGTTTGSATGTAVVERPNETPEAVDAELDLDAQLNDLNDLEERDDRGLRRAGDGGREQLLPRQVSRAGDEDDVDADDDVHGRYDDEDDRYDDDDVDDDAYDGDEDDTYGDPYDDDTDEAYARDDEEPLVDRAPRPYRPGRGGFDPDAAAAVAQARYAFRQRVALGLIAVAVLSALAALVGSSAMWWLHVVADVVLVGYLVFLRRQTRIEEAVRARRAARLSGERRALEARRERQAEHEARMASIRQSDWIDDEYDEYDEYDEDDEDDEDDPVPDEDAHDRDVRTARRSSGRHVRARRWAAPPTPPPPVPDDLELVDDSDDDPAFHDLDGERTYGYRRVAGA